MGIDDGSGIASHYEPEVVMATDYYPFGAEMPGRDYKNPDFMGTNDYRFGFNGKELDKSGEWGSLSHYDYGFRIYNPAIGKFLSVDPLTKSYPMLTPYQFASNRPIDGVDLDGLEWEAFMAGVKRRSSGVEALKVVNLNDGFGPVHKASYNLISKASRNDFERLKGTYITDPGILHNPNNDFATYFPIESKKDDDNILGVGDHMFIDITGPINDYVRFSEIKVDKNSFYIKALTLEGHTDAGFITFQGKYNESSKTIEFSIYNETTNNIGLDAVTFNIGRMAQSAQWKVVLDNVANYIGGDVLKMYTEKEILKQNAKPGDGANFIKEDLLTGQKTEELKPNSGTNGG